MPVTSFYIFHISPGKQYNALVKMAYAGALLRKTDGCSFAKLMGSGAGPTGFRLTPNFKLYVAIMVWDSVEQIKKFESTNRVFLAYKKITSCIDKFYGKAFYVHGKWNGIEPFKVEQNVRFNGSRIIVLTRARIKLSQIRNFWSFVPKTSDALASVKGRVLSIGIGELPLIFQATLSIWESQEDMREYAYKNPHHLAVIKKTKELNWYAEELFGRFYLITSPENDNCVTFD